MEILESLGIVTIIGGLLTWLIKSLGQNFINKNFSAYKLQLENQSNLYKNELNQALEKFKAELNLISEKATKLHSKRLERIEKIYELIINFQNDMTWLVSARVVTGMTQKEIQEQEFEQTKKAEKSGAELFNYYEKNKLYFNKDTCELLEEILKLLKDSYTDFSMKYIFGTMSAEFEIEKTKRVSENIKDKVPKIKIELENNFREIIGVE